MSMVQQFTLALKMHILSTSKTSPVDLCCHAIHINKEGIDDTEHFVTPGTPYLFVGGNRDISAVPHNEYWMVNTGRIYPEVTPQ